jgi:hypothetical protein
LPRQTAPIPFGGGLDRDSGIMVVDKSAFSDIRNWHLRYGKMVLRGGNGNTGATFGTATDICGIWPIRARAKGAVVTYDFAAVGNGLKLWIVNADGTAPVDTAAPFFFIGGQSVPRIIMTDVYGRLFIAHDEPDISKRMSTVVYNLNTGAFEGIGGLDGSPIFRGVTRYLSYLIGWGYGTNADPDRPETLRISLPGQPTVFDPQHYFLVGQQGEPVLACDKAGQVLALKKLSETFQLVGYDRATFGVQPLDGAFGQIAQRLSVSVGNVNYFWSESGPRRTAGGESEDLAIPLNLLGPAPDPLASGFDTDDAFAYYDHDQREVVFSFGQWQYVLHLSDPSSPRWGYNQLGVKVGCAGTFYELAVSTLAAPPAIATTLVAHTASTDGSQTWSVSISGTPDPTDAVEWWVREKVGTFANVWVKKFTELVASRSSWFTTISGLWCGEPSDWAIRPSRLGVPGSAYVSADPTLWPAATRHVADPAAFTTLPTPINTEANYIDNGTDQTLEIVSSPFTGEGTHIRYEAQVSDGVGGWDPSLTILSFDIERFTCDVSAYVGLTRDVRYRRKTLDGLVGPTAWVTIAGVVFTDPLAALITAVNGAPGDIYGIYIAGRGMELDAGKLNTWHGRDNTGMNAPNIFAGAVEPPYTAGPPRISFNGTTEELGDITIADNPDLAPADQGMTVVFCIKCTEAGAVRRPMIEQFAGLKPALWFDASGDEEVDYGDAPGSGADRRGDWVILGFTGDTSTGTVHGYDGSTDLGADTGPGAPIGFCIMNLLRGTGGAHFKGDLYAIIVTRSVLTATDLGNIYTELSAVALVDGITVTN